uniref:site-specific DNA-methyltransferase (cytosine-N(4)-specific) n=1 Tax=Candidatus Kentrum sp. MB TaxID=2138164 RepID=A0A451BEG0_9GAMM|nr:MAG: DNA methylase [Candidatus Kentron sp. MB]VFK76666.1 MAG: DNA methylase [Candidatus Kentron sp. MB]
MISATQRAHIRPIHPFPARMAPPIVWDALPESDSPLNILDPMSGSGTTLVCARSKGHNTIGCDTDPLALLIAQAWCSDVDPARLKLQAGLVLEEAMALSKKLTPDASYPQNANEETRRFMDFWFDPQNRCELNTLATCISRVRSKTEKTLLWCAFSRMIITKNSGVSLAIDVSHSRPHKVRDVAPVKPFDIFLGAISKVVNNCPFSDGASNIPAARIRYGDARLLPVESGSVDMVITSPPYLNAIDYLRGHKLSLVWMGHNISEIRTLRSSNIRAEVSKNSTSDGQIQEIVTSMTDPAALDGRRLGMIRRYICDMDKVMKECARVLKSKGRAIFVIGDSAIQGVFIRNSEALIRLADNYGFYLKSRSTRTIETTRRYLPSPEYQKAGNKMQGRMREEVILEFCVD